METKNGTAYIIWIDTITPVSALKGASYRPVLCGVTNGFNMSRESISMRTKCDDGWDRTKSGYGSWGMSLSGHAVAIIETESAVKANFQQVGQLLIDKTEFWCKMADVTGDIVREGVARISDYSETADMETPYSFDVTIIGIGKPIFDAKPEPLPPGTVQVHYGSYSDVSELTEEIILSWPSVIANVYGSITIPFNNISYLFNGFAVPTGFGELNHWQKIGGDFDEGTIQEGNLFEPAIEVGDLLLYPGGYEIPLTAQYLISNEE